MVTVTGLSRIVLDIIEQQHSLFIRRLVNFFFQLLVDELYTYRK